MNAPRKQPAATGSPGKAERTFQRFTIRPTLGTCHPDPERGRVAVHRSTAEIPDYRLEPMDHLFSREIEQIQQIHHIFALLLIAEVLYHLVRGISLMARRRLPERSSPPGRMCAMPGR